MSAKVREILILSVLLVQMLHSSFIDAQPNCTSYEYSCDVENYVEVYCNSEESTTPVLLRYESCPDGFICHISELGNCEPALDCEGKTFLCLTSSSYASCVKKFNGTYMTFSKEVNPCWNDKYCDNADDIPCDRLEEPTTEEPTTEEPTTEEPTTEEPTTEEPATEEPTTEEPATEEPTTEEPTTEEPATEEPTTEEPTTIAPALGELVGYTCAGVDSYPHPTDCHRYIDCYSSGLNRQFQCPNGFAYHTNDKSCKRDPTPCDNMDFKCVATGLFANPLNPSKYIWCLKINGVYHVSNYSCPAGKIFDGKNACVVPILP